MSSPKWTEGQQAAIDLRGQILVAAAAGSGKTAVLVERLIRRITDPAQGIDVDRFLLVTFTKAAANEMRERIGKALDDAMYLETNTEEIERLIHQRTLLPRASITTLHSFCMELLRQYFYQLELDPTFRVADEAEADLLRQDIVVDLFEKYYESGNSDFHACVDAFGTDRDDQPLMEQALRLYEFSMSQPNPEKWLKGLAEAYDWPDIEGLLQSPWGMAVKQGIVDKVEESIDLIERAYHIATQPYGPLQYADIFQDDLARLKVFRKSLEGGDWATIEGSFQKAVDFPRLPTKRAKGAGLSESEEELQKALKEESKDDRDHGKKILNKLKEDLFTFTLTEQFPLLGNITGLVHTLTNIVLDFTQEYETAKRQRNMVDFSDLEHLALKLLEKDEGGPSELAYKLKDFYEEVLVDEYQDINPVQERILQLVSRQEHSDSQEGKAPNLFMVGDVKQSIYRFRMADPNLFLRKYDEIPHWTPKVEQGDRSLVPNKCVIDLNKNFRSRSEVIDGINLLFYQIMTKGAGEIDYDEQAALYYGASFVSNPEIMTAEGPIELHLYDPKAVSLDNPNRPQDGEMSGSDDSTEEEVEVEAARIEARFVAKRIQDMVQGREFQIYDKHLSDFRPVQYSDIVILMRSFAAIAPVFTEEFQNAGIPVYAETTTGYFGATEVEIVLSLLKVIDNPRLDIPLASVLRSPIVGMNGMELGRLRSLLPNGDFCEALVLAYWAAQELRHIEDFPDLSDSSNSSYEELFYLNSELSYSQEELSEKNISYRDIAYIDEIKETLRVYEKSLPKLLEKAKTILQQTPSLREKVESFYPRLQEWREISRSISLADLIWQLYEDTGYLAYVGTLPSGVQRQANLRVLYDRACRFEKTNYRGLFRFLRFLEKFQGQGKDLGKARILGENENVVRLITVHASKGLEFPVVFMVGLGRKFNARSLIGKLLLHSELGAGIPIIDVEHQIRYPSFIQYAVKQKLWQESLAEELRILYVALTRAKERLFLYGSVEKLEETLQLWRRLGQACSGRAFSESQLRSAKRFFDWIGPAVMRQEEGSAKWDMILHYSLNESETANTMEAEIELEPQQQPKSQQLSIGEVIRTEAVLGTEPEKDVGTVLEATDKTETDFLIEEECAEVLYQEVDQRLSWEYPDQEQISKSVKTSVSELKRRHIWYGEEDQPQALQKVVKTEDDYARPKFMQAQKQLTPAERGSAVHTLIQHIPLHSWGATWSTLSLLEKRSRVEELVKTLVQRQVLTTEQAEVVFINSIVTLLDSDLGARLLTAEDVRREVPFTLSMVPEDQPGPVLVQGVMDAIIIDASRGVAEVIDFKTDNLKYEVDPEKTLVERYALQLAIYAKAVERLLKVKVEKCTIYAISINKEVVIPQRKNPT